MAREPVIRIFLSRFRTTKQKELMRMLSDKGLQKELNKIIANEINEFVPMKSGALRRSIDVTPESISWGKGLKYGHYQYAGRVYGPNHPITRKGKIVGWYSTPGMKKHPTGRELGVPGEWKGWRFGYTTPNTGHHWDKYFTYGPKLRANQEITRRLKRECKARGLKV